MISLLNNIERAIGIILAFILLPILLPLFLKLFRGAKRYSAEEINTYKKIAYSKKYKVYDKVISIILVIVGLAIIVVGIVGISSGEVSLQRLLFAREAIYFSGSDILITFFFLNFLTLLLFLFGFFMWLLLTVIKGNYKKYLIVQNAKQGFPYKPESIFLRTLVMISLLYLITTPFSYLVMHDYKAVYNDRIIANSLFNPIGQEYSFNQIQDVYYFKTIGKSTVTRLIFNFKNNRSIDFYSSVAGPTNTEIMNLYKVLKQQKIPVSGFPYAE